MSIIAELRQIFASLKTMREKASKFSVVLYKLAICYPNLKQAAAKIENL